MATSSDTFAPTITASNITPGMVLDFKNEIGQVSDLTVFVGEAEVIAVESPDGLGEYFGLYVSPEDGSSPEVYVHAYPWQSFEIVG